MTTTAAAKKTTSTTKAKTQPKAAPKETTVPKTTELTAEQKSIQSAAANKPTEVHENFVAWLAEAGVEADLETVKLAFALRHVFQKSDANQAHLANRRNAAEAKLQAKAERAAEQAKKAAEKAAKLAEAAAKK